MVSHGLFNGTDKGFELDAPMTRGMLFTGLARLDGQDTNGGTTYSTKAFEWGVKTGLTDCTNPDGNITREQIATLLYRYAGSPAVSGVDLTAVKDAEAISDYAKNALAWVINIGLFQGDDNGNLSPKDNATRASP
ncbi:MAG: S-layer homology domain-containing protein [Oscillospiraceae bacterium]|nr:S-layer homology domain-containing protein [Oscillospiraceae bacterium]